MATADLRPGAKGIVLLLLLNLLPSLEARLQLANTLGSHMVLQRAPHRAVLYGMADGWAKIDVRVQAETEGASTMDVHTAANKDGAWEVLLEPVENVKDPFQVGDEGGRGGGIEGGTEVGHMRLSQYSAFTEPAVFMAPSFDLGYGGDIHPKDKQDVADRLVEACLLTAYDQFEYLPSLGPHIHSATASIPETNAIELQLTFANAGSDIVYAHVPALLELLLLPSLRDSPTQALSPSHTTRLSNDTYSFTYLVLPSSLPPSASASLPPSVWLRYGGRNNVCPPRQVPGEEGRASATCGVYALGPSGYRPMLPTWKEVELRPFPAQTPS
ncbi:hypothetical protein NSK_006143 [Nannochloropsis salina CCMP1776]|uniref:Uncharacterized protein n=1 Tax=Nannochloropsis salina CCMP1776 TaxID=1027361 RepID=A0A4D9CTH3_9STRA|nr:hypothetical protein NSK_006143 [Nannochloropsis salina CCMP1776]|eukprot:TFJ82541.1 hypothetical protein NSK_006143 [Nannochloropsis salina CCMP1776]